jgi:exodeoxyribonuclease V alpha subunit
MGRPAEGEVWEFAGNVVHSPEYGAQVHVRTGHVVSPSGRLLVRYLAEHDAFRPAKIGNSRARALWAYFGDRLFGVLDAQDRVALEHSSCVPAASIGPLIDAWKSQREELAVVRWLQENRFPSRLARRLLAIYGSEAVAKLEQNPYRMLAFCPFKDCETAALAVGVPLDDERRLVAIVQEVLYRELEGGHTLVHDQLLLEKAAQIAGSSELAAQGVVSASCQRLIARSGACWGLMGIRSLEESVAIALSERTDPDLQLSLDDIDEETVRSAVARFQAEAGFDLNVEQRVAVKLALGSKLAVVCGGAGVGKTTVLRAIAVAMPTNTWFMALTGQAAKRIGEATKGPASTIARFLNSLVGQIPPGSAPLIVVDEASMLDLATAARLLRALPDDARLLFVGDPDQLPPIGFGLIFHRLVGSPVVPQTELTVINRQKGDTGIPQASVAVRNGRLPALIPFCGQEKGVFAEQCSRNGILNRLIELRRVMPGAQILCPKNAGGVGVADVNARFFVLESEGRQKHESIDLAVDAPVIYKKNDSALGLVNGSLGRVVEILPHDVRCDFDGEIKTLSGESLQHLKLAYGLTVHSAQGSQFADVIVVVEGSRVMDRTWVYTAITRAVRRIVVVGDINALDTAVRNPPSASKRNVGFSLKHHQREAA